VKGIYLMPSKDTCMSSDSCEMGILNAFTIYLYVIRFLWMGKTWCLQTIAVSHQIPVKGHTWCLHKISVCHHIPANGAYLMLSKDRCMPWLLWMGHTWCLHKIILTIYVSCNRQY
jgi:hypothetical protein